MTQCNLQLRYTLADGDAERPQFAIKPDAGDAREIRFTATHLRSVDRLDVKWSTVETMKPDPVKTYLASIGRKGGSVTSEAKAAAVRANGKKGGRPPGAKDSKPRKRSGRKTGVSSTADR